MNDHIAPDADDRFPDLSSILVVVWQKKLLVGAVILASLLAGILYLWIVNPTYTVEMRVTAAASSSNSIANRLGNLGGLAAAAGLPIGGSSKAEPFDLYIEALTSREVADELARDPRIMKTIFAREWDANTGHWKSPPVSPGQWVKSLLGHGEAHWRAPDGARLRDYLQRKILVTKSAKSPITLIGYDVTDPDFGIYLLARMNQSADNDVRRRALEQANDYKAYLASVLPTVELADVRRSLADSLTQQYEAVMMARSSVPYAAAAIGAPQASLAPTKPKVAITLAICLLLGTIIGIAVAVIDFGGTFGRRHREVAGKE